MTAFGSFAAAIKSGHINGFFVRPEYGFTFNCLPGQPCSTCPVDLADACHHYPANHPISISLQDQYPELFL